MYNHNNEGGSKLSHSLETHDHPRVQGIADDDSELRTC